MSLRADIHDAVDEVAPPAPMLASRVVASVHAEGRDRRPSIGRRVWNLQMGRGMSMVAAVLVVVLMTTVVVGGHVWRDWTSYQGQQAMSAQLGSLEKRSIDLPTVKAGDTCPDGPYTYLPSVGVGLDTYGGGPVYLNDHSTNGFKTDWGYWFEMNVLLEPSSSGLILIRARDLRTQQSVVFSQKAFVNGSWYDVPVGDVAVRDSMLPHDALGSPGMVIDLAQHLRPRVNGDYYHADYDYVGTLVGYPNGVSGCVGYQVDGAGFSEKFVVDYTGFLP